MHVLNGVTVLCDNGGRFGALSRLPASAFKYSGQYIGFAVCIAGRVRQGFQALI